MHSFVWYHGWKYGPAEQRIIGGVAIISRAEFFTSFNLDFRCITMYHDWSCSLATGLCFRLEIAVIDSVHNQPNMIFYYLKLIMSRNDQEIEMNVSSGFTGSGLEWFRLLNRSWATEWGLRLSPTGDSKPFSTLYIEKIPFSICSSSVLNGPLK
jgi:hypothetical protein